MNKMILGALMVGMALAAPTASARTFQWSGVGCVPADTASAACVSYSQFGVQNNCSGTATVECSMATSIANGSLNPPVTFVSVGAYDRNSGSNVSCMIQRVDGGGIVTYQTPWTTSGSSASLDQHAIFPPASTSLNGNWRVRCGIPGIQAGQLSHVSSMTLFAND